MTEMTVGRLEISVDPRYVRPLPTSIGKSYHTTEDAFMVPGMGTQPVPVKEWVAANDNHPDWNGIAQNAVDRFPTVHETLVKSERGQYIGIPRPGDPNGCADDLVTTTFAPLGELPAWGDKEWTEFYRTPTKELPIGVCRGAVGSGKPYLYTSDELAEKVAEAFDFSEIDDLARIPGFIYLGSPYAKYHAGMEEAARLATECAGELMARGIRVYCPIAHGHAVTRYQELPRTWDYWKHQDQPLINAAMALVVIEMRGWRESVGLRYEIESFSFSGKPIIYVKPDDLGVIEPGVRKAA